MLACLLLPFPAILPQDLSLFVKVRIWGILQLILVLSYNWNNTIQSSDWPTRLLGPGRWRCCGGCCCWWSRTRPPASPNTPQTPDHALQLLALWFETQPSPPMYQIRLAPLIIGEKKFTVYWLNVILRDRLICTTCIFQTCTEIPSGPRQWKILPSFRSLRRNSLVQGFSEQWQTRSVDPSTIR